MGVTPQPVHEGTPAVWDENRMLSVRRRVVWEGRCVERRGSMNSIACAATSRQAMLRRTLGLVWLDCEYWGGRLRTFPSAVEWLRRSNARNGHGISAANSCRVISTKPAQERTLGRSRTRATPVSGTCMGVGGVETGRTTGRVAGKTWAYGSGWRSASVVPSTTLCGEYGSALPLGCTWI